MKGSLCIGLAILGGSLLAAHSHAQLRELNSTRDGRGTLNFRTRSSSSGVTRAQVILSRNGRAEIRLLGGSRETFRGDWHNESAVTCRIMIDRIGNDIAAGDGTVEHDGRGNFAKIALSGNVSSTRFSLDFSANTDYWNSHFPRPPMNEDEKFVKHVHQAIEGRYPRHTRFVWEEDKVSSVVFGNRQVNGRFVAYERNHGTRYKYGATLGAGTASVKALHIERM